MSFVNSASVNTLKNYRVDLIQAFGLQKYGDIHISDDLKQIMFIKNDQTEASISEKDLLRICSEAQNRWGQLSLASRNRKAACLKSFLQWGFETEELSENYALKVYCPKVPKKIPHFLSVDEVMSVLRSFKEPEQSQQKLLFLLIYGGGLRISEACQIRWSDIKIENRKITIHGKGNKDRIVTFPKLTFIEIKNIKNKKQFIWGEKALDRRTAYDWIRQSGIQAGLLKNLHPHALRHSFATHMLSSGANLRTLQEILGHQSLQATEKYTHLGLDQLAQTLESHHPISKSNTAKRSA